MLVAQSYVPRSFVRTVFSFVVCYSARDENGRESDAGTLDAEEILGERSADPRPRSSGAGSRRGAHHAKDVSGYHFRMLSFANRLNAVPYHRGATQCDVKTYCGVKINTVWKALALEIFTRIFVQWLNGGVSIETLFSDVHFGLLKAVHHASVGRPLLVVAGGTVRGMRLHPGVF